MSLTPGTRLGPYEILSPIGAGGMGEVYRARDTKLNRDVAIKVLPNLFASDADRLARFTREAQTLAALNHPNIAIIHGLEQAGGVHALVMELVAGEDLSQRIARGAIPLDEALPIAKQIAEALEAAHEQGIIHRDLKPANIKLRPDGTVKVLDFGLAKALAPETDVAAGVHLSQSPTIMSPVTSTSVAMILGTAAYMSPEQARGKAVDRRADIWAFGCVMFEMLTARAAFGGEDVAEILSRVLQNEPDWALLPKSLPPSVSRLLRLCLRKDPKKRRQTAADVRNDLEDAVVEPVVAAPHARGAQIAWVVAAGALLIGAALAIPALRHLREGPPSLAPEMRLEIATPPTSSPASLAISPDGRRIVFSALHEGTARLLLRSLDSTASHALVGTDGATYPFWSPDNRSVGFFADGQLKRIDIDNGSVQALANAPAGRGGSWNADGTILFAPNQGGAIFQIASGTREPVEVTRLELPQQASHRFPWFLPDGRHFLFTVTGGPETRGVYVGQLGDSGIKRLHDADAYAVYASSGHLLMVRQDMLFAQPFDPIRLALTGNQSLMSDTVAVVGGVAAVSASAKGTVVYREGSAARSESQLAWFDRSGKDVGRASASDIAGVLSASLSPDGQQLAISRRVDGKTDVWLLDVGRDLLRRFTLNATVGPGGGGLVWYPDGGRIVFTSSRTGSGDLYQKALNGGSEELLLATAQNKTSMDVSPDGRFLLYRTNDPDTSSDIWALPLTGDRKPVAVVGTTFDERDGQFSPDGKWVAFQSNEPGRFEIFVQRFPGPGERTQISTNGGSQVRWRQDGKELFYVGQDRRLTAAPIRLRSNGEAVDVGTPSALFATRLTTGQMYNVSPDGQRFIMSVDVEQPSSSVTVLLKLEAIG